MEKISLIEKISVDDRNVIDGVKRELRRVISTVQKQNRNEDDSIMRLMAEKELSKICDKVSNLSIKEACLQQSSLFATAYDADDQLQNEDIKNMNSNIITKQFTAADDQLPNKEIIPNHNKGRRRNKRKTKQIASPTQRKQPHTDEKDTACLITRAELDEMKTLKKHADLEADDYKQTIQFMKEILETHKEVLTDNDTCFITHAYQCIAFFQVQVDVGFCYIRAKNLADGMSLIKSYRLKVENDLQDVCKLVSNAKIKEILLEHFDEFKKGPKPSKERVAIPYTRNPSHVKELMIQKKKERADIIAKEKEKKYGYHDHSKCIEIQEERYYPRYVHTGDWDPISEGGIDLLSAPGRDSKKVYKTVKAEYEKWREEFNIHDTSPERPLEEYELVDFILDD